MNTAMKVGAASALTLAGMAAHASISQPSTGSSDAILFAAVFNATAGTTVASYAGDTGISISTLEAGGYSQTGVLGNDTNLANLYTALASHPGDVVEFAVLGGQYTGNATSGNFATPGVAQFLTTTYNNGTASLAGAPGAGTARTIPPEAAIRANSPKPDSANCAVTSVILSGLRRSGLSDP